jgi:hypothetical protein
MDAEFGFLTELVSNIRSIDWQPEHINAVLLGIVIVVLVIQERRKNRRDP